MTVDIAVGVGGARRVVGGLEEVGVRLTVVDSLPEIAARTGDRM